MPGLPQKDIDTSSWGVKEWRRDRQWGACFLVFWVVVWGLIAVELFREHLWWGWWVSLAFYIVVGGGGIIVQVAGLIRTTVWLNKQEAASHHDLQS